MVKSLDHRQFHRKKKRRRLFAKKIKFIRNSYNRKYSSESTSLNTISCIKNIQIENENYLNFSLINAVYSYVNKNLSDNENINTNEIKQNSINIIKNLSMNMNIYTVWILLIEYYETKFEYKWDYETMFYIGLVAKEIFNPNFADKIKDKITLEKLNYFRTILSQKKINFKEMNKRIKENNSHVNIRIKKSVNFDFESMVNYISTVKDEKDHTKKQKNEKIRKEKSNKNEEINDINQISNESEKKDENENYESEEEAPPYGLFNYDNEQLPEDNHEKLDESYHKINFRQIFKELGYLD